MYKIIRKKELNPTVTLMEVEAPFVARKAEPGQFIILRVDEEGERIPLTISNAENDLVTVIYQKIGGTTLALDSGTSVAELVHVLADEGRDMGIDVITPSIQTASETCRFFRTSMPGGYVFPDEVSIGGMSAVRFLEGITTDIAFLGTTGICNTKGLTVSYPLMMDVKRALLSSASKKVALVDSSKFLSRGIYTYCSFRELDTLITVRTEENAPVLDEIAKQGVEIILA